MNEDRTRLYIPLNGVTIRSIWGKKWLVVAITGLCVAAGAVYLCFATPVYEVKTRLTLAKGADPTKGLQEDVREDRYFMGTQAEAIGSPLIVRQALERAPVSLPAGCGEDLMTFVLESLKVSPIVNTNVMTIRFHGADPDEATRFVAALVGSYEERIRDFEANSGSEVLDLLTQRETELRKELKLLEAGHAEMRKASPLVGQGEDQIESTSAILGEIARNLATVRVRRCELESRLAALDAEVIPAIDREADEPVKLMDAMGLSGRQEKVLATGLRDGETFYVSAKSKVLDTIHLENMAGRLRGTAGVGAEDLADIEKQLRLAVVNQDRLSQQHGELHPASLEAQAEIVKWQTLLQERLSVTAGAMQHQYEMESATEEGLHQLYGAELEKAKELDDHLVREKGMLAEIERTEQVYNAVFNQLTDMELLEKAMAKGRTSILIRDLDGPDRKAELLWPLPAVFLAACAALGFAMSVLLVFGIEVFRQQPASRQAASA